MTARLEVRCLPRETAFFGACPELLDKLASRPGGLGLGNPLLPAGAARASAPSATSASGQSVMWRS